MGFLIAVILKSTLGSLTRAGPDSLPVSQDHSLSLGQNEFLHLFQSTIAPPSYCSPPTHLRVLANGDAITHEGFSGNYPLKTDPSGPFQEWRRLISYYQQGHLRAPLLQRVYH